MSHLQLVIDNKSARPEPSLSTGPEVSARNLTDLVSLDEGRIVNLMLAARPTAAGNTVREILQQANTILLQASPDGQAQLSRWLMDLIKVGLLLDVSLAPEYPAHIMVFEPDDLVQWLPELQAYLPHLVYGTTFSD